MLGSLLHDLTPTHQFTNSAILTNPPIHSRPGRCSRFSSSPAHREPDEEGEHSDRGSKGSAKQPQCAMQDGLAVQLDFDVERRALEAIREVLLPREDVAARG